MPASTHSWCGSLRLTSITSTTVVATNLLIGGLIIPIIMLCPVGTSSAVVVEVGLTAAEAAASLVLVVFSSHTSSSSQSLRMMILSSPGGPTITRLSSPKSLWANAKSWEVAVMRSSSFEDEDRSITGAFLEPPPAWTLVSKDGVKTSPTEILVVVETQLAPMEESWRRWWRTFLHRGRVWMFGTSLVLHWWLAESERGEP
jgi:hypothetical protein